MERGKREERREKRRERGERQETSETEKEETRDTRPETRDGETRRPRPRPRPRRSQRLRSFRSTLLCVIVLSTASVFTCTRPAS
eukprot:2008380-Rhodomonas_salina.1